MKYHLLYNVVAVAVSLCLSCSDELPSEQPPQPVPEAALMDAVPGVVCMQVSEELAGRLSDAGSGTETRAMQSCLTRSADAIRLNSVEPVFRIGGKFEARQRRSGLHRWYKVRFDNEVPVSSAIRTLSKEQGVESVEPVYPIYLEGEAAWPLALPASDTRISNAGLPFNDPLLGKQWALHNDASLNAKFVAGADVNAFEAWKVTTGTPNVIVAVLDHGVYVTHEDLADAMRVNVAERDGLEDVDDDGNGYVADVYGYNFADGHPYVYEDTNDHGTHCAGIIGARSNNGIGIAGIAGGNGTPETGVRLMSCQCIGRNEESNSAPAFVYAADNGAVIANCSWMLPLDPYERLPGYLEDAMNYFIRFAGCDNEGNQLEGSPMKGGLIVAAAGNDGQTIKHYPAAYEPVIAVSSYGPQMKAAWYTCRGSWVDICGPGGDAMYQGANGDILSAVKPSANNAGESYLTKFGTSQASPYVAGIAALVVSAKGGKGFTNEDCKARILNALRPFDINEQNPSLKNTLGRGYIDAARALDDNQHKRPASTELTLRTLYNQIILSWKISADEDDGMANTYRIYYSEKAFAATDLAQAIPAGSPNVSAASELRYIEVFTGVRKAGETYTFTLDRLKVNQHYYLAIVPFDRWGLTADPAFAEGSTENKLPYIENLPTEPLQVSNLKPTELDLTVVEPDGHQWVCTLVNEDFGYTMQREGNVLHLIIRAVRPLGEYAAEILFRDELGAETTVQIPYVIVAATTDDTSDKPVTFTMLTTDLPLGIALSPYFSLAQDQQVVYTCEVSEGGIARAEVFQDMLKVTPLAPGIVRLTVRATDAHNNRQQQQFTLRVTEMATAEEPFVYSTYPSLLRDLLYIQLSEKSRESQAVIRSTSGREVLRVDLKPDENLVATVQVGRLAPGVYKLEVVSSAGTYKQTIMKGA